MPVTVEQYKRSMEAPPLCEQLRIRDLLDDIAVQCDGSMVAGFEVGGIQSYYASDEGRNRVKGLLEALVRSLPERSMRMQVRFEITEGTGDLVPRYIQERKNDSQALLELDRLHVEAWRGREATGFYLQHFLRLYFIWNPRIHRQPPDFELKHKMKSPAGWSLSAEKCIERSRREHEDFLAEFNSLLAGVDASLQATGMPIRRMSEEDLFVEIKRALHPLANDTLPYRPSESSIWYQSARSQVANTSIEDEQDDYLKIGGLLYSWITLKDLPDATFPGILRDLVVMDFPLVISAEVTLPDQAKSIKHYKSRLRKMLAAQKDFHGGFRINVDAQVAEHQLIRVLQDLISSSLKACQMSLIVCVRTSKPCRNRLEREEAERILADRRQRVLHAIGRMNGCRGIPETLAQKRLFFSSLPVMGGENKRELDLLTLNAADLLPVEMPWQGTPQSPLMLFETPYRQLVPFSPFDPSLGDANMLIMGKTGGGKTFMAQLFLIMMARADVQVSILERGDSYRPLVELMGGRVVDVKLDGMETLNPWDLPQGETTPTKEKIAFLKNLAKHMIGEDPETDNALLDYLLSDAIARTYARRARSFANPVPTFTDLREELEQWRSPEHMQSAIDTARLAAIKLGAWTGERGIYANLFDAHTSLQLDKNWLYFNIEGLRSDPRLETAMSMLIANTVASRSAGSTGQASVVLLDECWFLLDSPALAPEVVQLYRTARKRHVSVWGISQTVEDFVGTEFQPREHGPGILKNATTKIIGQQPGDTTGLVNHLFLNPVAVAEVKALSSPRKGESADALLVLGEKAETTQTIRLVPTPLDYWVCTTFPRERKYRNWFLKKFGDRPLLDNYRELARRFPRGLAQVASLQEEVSGEVNREAA